jgi:starch phosphorylase
VEANELYDLLERAVIPEFYDRGADDMPLAWIKRMRESMARLTPQFSANRAVREYTERHYLPAAVAYRKRAADKGVLGRQIADWQRELVQKWGTLRFGSVRVNNTQPDQHEVDAEIFLNGIDPNAVRVELYADDVNDKDSVGEMTRVRTARDSSSPDIYRVTLSSRHPICAYTARVIPTHANVSLPLEYAPIAWQR